MERTAWLAVAAGASGERSWILRLLQVVVTLVLIAFALAWIERLTARRRRHVRGTAERPLLAYPPWTVGLGLGCMALFSACAWFAAHAPPQRGGTGVALVFAGFVLLGALLAVSAVADRFSLDADGIERRRFGRPRRLAWSALARITVPWGGQGIRLVSRDGTALELSELLDGFGVLCDALLSRAPGPVRVTAPAAALLLKGSSLPPEALQHAYAPWFEAEEAEPPPGLPPADLALALGRAFATRLLLRHGSFLPFEARWTRSATARITHGEPRGEDPGHASFRQEGTDVVIGTDAATWRESLGG